ncbi:bulb-type lectin domain-containing protein [Tanacetum coccineum]
MNRSWKPDLCNDSTVASEPKVRLKRRKEEVGCVEDKQRMDAVKEKAIEAIMRYCDSLYFKENTIEEKLNGSLPPVIGVTKVDLLGLYKFVDSLGGYMDITLNNKWNKVAHLLGLAQEDQEAVKECYKEYIGMVKICYEGTQRSKQERPGEDVVRNSRGTAWIKEPQAFAKISVEVRDALDGTPRKKSRIARDDVNKESNKEATNEEREASTSSMASEPKVRLKRRKEEVGCVEDKQRMDAVKEKAIEAIMRYCDSLYFKENTIEEKLNGSLPLVIGVTKVDLLGLYKFVDDLGGYMNVSFNNKWNEIAKLLGVTQEDQEAVKECYKEYIRMVKICYEGAQRSKQERPGEDVVRNSRGTAWIKEPQAFAKISVEVRDALDGTPRKKSRIARDDVNKESNKEATNEEREASTSSSDDFIIIT